MTARTKRRLRTKKLATRKKALSGEKVSDFEVFTRLNDAVSAEYWEDLCKAGVITSKIQHEPPMYYVAVARYRAHHTDKQILVSAKDASLSKALRDVAATWVKCVTPPPMPPKEELKKFLRDGL